MPKNQAPVVTPENFDPSAAALEGTGIYGLPFKAKNSRVIVMPVGFDATTSYRPGTAGGPMAIFDASKQVEVYDPYYGDPIRAGIFMLPPIRGLARKNAEARKLAEPIIACGGQVGKSKSLLRALAEVNAISRWVNDVVYRRTRKLLEQGKLVGLVGGDHSTPYGSIRAHAEKYDDLTVLHFDAHADLRPAYEGFEFSHASIMENVSRRIPGVARIVQVGVRDLSEEEHETIRSSGGRITPHFDVDLKRARRRGEGFESIAQRIAADLPERVYVSFDIDGLDPTLCPHTGTPVPGGLSFDEAVAVVEVVALSGRTIVGFDLNEVAPGPEGDEWDGNVGARMLYKLIGWMLVSQGLSRSLR